MRNIKSDISKYKDILTNTKRLLNSVSLTITSKDDDGNKKEERLTYKELRSSVMNPAKLKAQKSDSDQVQRFKALNDDQLRENRKILK